MRLNEYLKKEYGRKLYKLALDQGLSCPNRDGSCGSGGCIFCSAGGSGDFAASAVKSITEQIEEAKARVAGKMKVMKTIPANQTSNETEFGSASLNVSGTGDNSTNCRKNIKLPSYIAYFQAFTNTYGPMEKLRKNFLEAAEHPDIAIVSIATRPDCLGDEVMELLEEVQKIKPVWVELGLQTSSDETAEYINRCYKTEVYDEAVEKLNAIGVKVITHVILGLPTGKPALIALIDEESREKDKKSEVMRKDETSEIEIESTSQILATIQHAVSAGTWGIKLQLLHILEGTRLAEIYREDGFHTYSLEEYVDLLEECVKIIPDDVVIHRLTGDGPKRLLIEPKWSGDKKRVLNTINKRLS